MKLTPWILLSALLVACTDDTSDTSSDAVGDTDTDASSDTDVDTDVNGDLDQVQLTIDEQFPTVVHITWESEVEGTSFVEYGLDGTLDFTTPETDSGASHAHTVLGLKAGRTYAMRPVTVDAKGTRLEGATQQVSLEVPPSYLPVLSISEVDASRSHIQDGWLLSQAIGADFVAQTIVDAEGDYVWWYRIPDYLSSVTLTTANDGKSIVFSTHDREQIEDLAQIYRVRLDGTEEVITRALMGHHAHVVLPNNQVGWLAQENAFVNIDGETWDLWADQIFVADEGTPEGTNPSEIFAFFDDYGHDPWVICSHMSGGSAWGASWTHTNSLSYVDGYYYVGSRWMDNILKIDGATGQIMWEMGGRFSDFPGWQDIGWFSHAHWSHIWEDGAVIFDNAVETSMVSGLMEIAFDEDTRTVTKVFDWRDPEGRFIQLGGDARKLPNGNYLVSFVQAGDVFEVHPSGDTVWRMQTELAHASGRVTWIEDIYNLPNY